MRPPPTTASIRVNGSPARISGYPPFMVVPAGRDSKWSGWMLIDVTKSNCVTFTDGLKAIFDVEATLIAIAQDLNEVAA